MTTQLQKTVQSWDRGHLWEKTTVVWNQATGTLIASADPRMTPQQFETAVLAMTGKETDSLLVGRPITYDVATATLTIKFEGFILHAQDSKFAWLGA